MKELDFLIICSKLCLCQYLMTLIECRQNTAGTPTVVLLVHILEVIRDATFAHQTIQ